MGTDCGGGTVTGAGTAAGAGTSVCIGAVTTGAAVVEAVVVGGFGILIEIFNGRLGFWIGIDFGVGRLMPDPSGDGACARPSVFIAVSTTDDALGVA